MQWPCGFEVATTPDGPVENKWTPRHLLCVGNHLTGPLEATKKSEIDEAGNLTNQN